MEDGLKKAYCNRLGLVGAKKVILGCDSGDEEVEHIPESLRGGINRAYRQSDC